MASRFIKLALIAAILVGGGLAIQGGIRQRALRAEYHRLKQQVGEMTVTDPNKIQIVAIPSDDPWEFVWRVYLPENQTYRWRTKSRGGDSSDGTSISRTEEQNLIRFRLRVNDGVFQKYLSRPGGSSYSSFGDPVVAKNLTNPREDLRAQQLAADGFQAIELDEVATLLKLEFTESFQQRMEGELDVPYQKKLLKEPFLTISFGTVEAFDNPRDPR